MSEKIRAAAVQMTADLGRTEKNRRQAKKLAEEALKAGARIVVLPEFFTSAVAFDPVMLGIAEPLEGPSMAMLKELATRFRAFVGGSYLAVKAGDVFNTFVLAMPDGRVATHDKDQPTMWENASYVGGYDDGVMETPLGPLGAAVCWELVRTRTVRRLRGRVKLLLAGSCWWTVRCDEAGNPTRTPLHRRNLELYEKTPSTIARLLGVPVIHATHAGDFCARTPFAPWRPYRSFFLGDTRIVDATGRTLSLRKRNEAEGVILADLELGDPSPSLSCPEGFWIHEMPLELRLVWHLQNWHGRRYYRRMKRRRKIPALVAQPAFS